MSDPEKTIYSELAQVLNLMVEYIRSQGNVNLASMFMDLITEETTMFEACAKLSILASVVPDLKLTTGKLRILK